MKFLIKALLILVLCGVGASLWIWHEARVFLDTAPETPGREIHFDVTPGAHLARIAEDLAARGLITNARKFVWLARYKKEGHKLQAGRFALNTGWKPERILDTLVNGSPLMYRVTVPEGFTWWQTGKLLEEAGLARFDDFQAVISDPEFLRHYGIPFASAEGFLMPDTYLLRKPDSPMPGGGAEPATEDERRIREEWRAQAKMVAGRLVDNFWRKSAPLWPGVADARPGAIPKLSAADLKKWVILASIVEKETGIPQERPRVAGVYANRLERNMPLQADPTVIYGLGPNFSGKISRSNLDDTGNAYNTYQHPGLPPGPIASFGQAALKAAINPEQHDFLYFVAITDGGAHNFSKTYEEHERAVREYRMRKSGG